MRWTLRDRWGLITNSFSHKYGFFRRKCGVQIFTHDLENLRKRANCKLHRAFLRINGLLFVIFFFTRSDLDETSCFIRVQMLGVTLPCHQTICAMAEYFPDFSLVFFSFFYWPTSLAWPRTRIWKRPPGFNWSRTTRVGNRTNHKEIESEISEPRYW